MMTHEIDKREKEKFLPRWRLPDRFAVAPGRQLAHALEPRQRIHSAEQCRGAAQM
jgi:hypothetical protein